MSWPQIILLNLGTFLACYIWYRQGVRDGIRKGQELAAGVSARTYTRAREEGWQAGYAEGLEDAGK